MPSQLPPVTSNATSALQQSRSEQTAALSKLLDLTLGTRALATVEKVSAITQPQRELLLAQTAALLAQLQGKAHNPAAKAQITSLLEQQSLLNSAALKLVQLHINGRQLLTYTDKPLQSGQSLAVKLDNLQRLIQLALLPAEQAPGKPQATAEQAVHKLQTHTMLATLLRNLLPQKDLPQQLLAALPQLQSLPTPTRNLLLPVTVQQALKTLADQLRTPQQLTNPKLLAMIFKNSGVQFEHKLAAHLPQSPGTPAASQASGHRPGALTAQSVNPALTNQLTMQDLKGGLLQLLDRVNRELAKIPAQASGSAGKSPGDTTGLKNTLALPSALFAPALPQANLLQILQQLPTRPQSELSDKTLRTQLMLLLQQHTLTSLAKIQLQQIHSINHQQAQADNAQPTQSWLFEIPVKQGQDVQPLEVRIDQEWVEDDQPTGEQTARKTKQWSVMLSFNLPELGGFYAQLTVLHDAVSAKLWAEHAATLQQAQARLEGLRQQLQAQGVEVKQLQCLNGTPPNLSISLNYSLVDITT